MVAILEGSQRGSWGARTPTGRERVRLQENRTKCRQKEEKVGLTKVS